MADTNKIKIDNTIFNNMNSLNSQLGNDFFTNYGNMNTESLELNGIKNVDYYYSNCSNSGMNDYTSDRITNAVYGMSSNIYYGLNGGSFSYYNYQKNDNNNNNNNDSNDKSKIEAIPKKKEKRKTNLINYEDYLENPSKYDYQMNNNATMYVNELYNKYRVFNSSKMAQILGDKYGSQEEFNEQQEYLKKYS